MNWKIILLWTLPLLQAASTALINKDADDTGADDKSGQALGYAVKILQALVYDTTIPTAPDSLR